MGLTIATTLLVLLAKESQPAPTKTYVTGFVAALQERIEDDEHFRYQALCITWWWRTSDPGYLRNYISAREFQEWRRGLREEKAKIRKLHVESLVLQELAERAKRKAEEAEREVERVKREVLEEQRQQKKTP
ncbi:unnamed protein product [Gemmata massiliana]|uniref:Uncharacterized protein n=1 Tax=Gemmata massiliana TaxID=1210884 RepID=A0A6P2CSL5_9BACT|nr:hypothetical protein [Gemmata massiliana]VTR91921.1 unnamed protein product [Gemmata massiliana]